MTVTHPINHAQIVIVGAGISGICTAYYLAQAGFDVAVLERRSNVAEEGTLCNSGLIAPAATSPITLPGILRTGFGSRLRRITPVITRALPNPARWGWYRKSRQEATTNLEDNKALLTRLALHGQQLIAQAQAKHKLDHENIDGLLHTFRKQEDAQRASALSGILAREDIKSSGIALEQLNSVEPALLHPPALAEARYYPDDQVGNCVLFTKQIKGLAQSMGVAFHFSETVRTMEHQGKQVTLHLDNGTFTADAVILCCGMQAAQLLRSTGVHLPLAPVQSYTAVASLKTVEFAPQGTVYDDTYRVAISRLGNRIKISGLLGFVPHTEAPDPKAVRTLLRIASDYFPNAVNYSNMNVLGRTFALTPNGMPLVGMANTSNVFINTAHGVHGWAQAVATSQLLTDYIMGNPSAIETSGLFYQA